MPLARCVVPCLVTLAAALLWPLSGSAQWRDVDEPTMLATLPPQRAAAASRREIVPEAYRTLQLDLASLRARLASAPREFSAPLEAGLEIVLPLPYGGFGRFLVLESPIMEPALAAKYPSIKTYVAQGIDDPTSTARLDLTHRGLRASVHSPRGQFFIDPYWKDDDTTYLSYYKRHLSPAARSFVCQVSPSEGSSRAQAASRIEPLRPTGASLRTYRLALAATGEYTAAVSGTMPGTVLQALGAMITSINRVNAIYEREFAIRLVLVANTDLLIYTDAATDPYSNGDGSSMLGQNQTNITNVIGSANYDIGHVFSTGGGGIVSGGACVASNKSAGVTGQPNPTQDPFDVDYVAHEMGHQFGANHTFNSSLVKCSGNRVGGSAFEPGSGTTIMAYAGICGSSNLAANSDDYFHTRSYEQIDAYTSAGSGICAVSTPTGNTPPVLTMPGNVVIPVRTPFALTGSALDPDGDALSYCWEEYDLGPTNEPIAVDNGTSPLFRSFAPSLGPTRYFPSLRFVLDAAANLPVGSNQPPISENGFALAETLPTTGRTMTFRLTVRDHRAGGGGSNFGSMTVTSTAAAGPFRITNFGAPTTLAAGSMQTLTWDVAGTTANGVNTANVKISLSTDGGLTFSTVLVASTPNNGSASFTIPDVAQIATTQGRLKVEAIGNVFFDINKANLTVTSTNVAPTLAVTGSITLRRGAGTATTAAVASAADANGDAVTAEVSGLPREVAASASVQSGVVSLTAQAACGLVTTYTTRIYPIQLTVTDRLGSTASATINLIVQPNDAPTLGAYGNVDVPRDGVSFALPAGGPADPNGNLGAAPFSVSPASMPGGGAIAIDQATGRVRFTTTASSTLGSFDVRVVLLDSCGAATVRQFVATVTAVVPTAPQFVSAAPASPLTVGAPYLHTFAASGSPAPTFSLLAGTLPTGLSLSPTGVLAGTPTSAGTGSFTNLTVRAENGVGPAAEQTFELRVRTLAANYFASYGLSGADAAFTADPNSDGVANGLAYALGLDPTRPSTHLLPAIGLKSYRGLPFAFLTFRRSSVATDLTYLVQASSDLVTWTTLATASGGAPPSGPGYVAETGSAPYFTVEVRDLEPASDQHRFLRLHVSTP